MIIFLQAFRLRPMLRNCAVAAGICLSGTVYGSELPSILSTETNLTTTATTTVTATALGKLQDFTNRASELVIRAIDMIGIRYKFGGNAPESGMDCSGLVRYLFKEVWDTNLPRTSEEISQVGQQIDARDLQPGDLVFYNTLRRSFSHVGIYLGDNKFIHAPSAGGQVRIESMDVSYWKNRFNGARRIADPNQR